MRLKINFEELKQINFNQSIYNDNSIVILGNCINELKKIDNNSIDLIFADPPYNIGKNFGNNKVNGVQQKNILNGVKNG